MSKKKILIIEDDRLLFSALEISVSTDDFAIISAGDGKSGLALAQKEKPDLVLLDLILPKMHGFEVLKALKDSKDTKNIPVIILTNLGQEVDKNKGLELGASAYYVKTGVDLDDLLQQIRQLLK